MATNGPPPAAENRALDSLAKAKPLRLWFFFEVLVPLLMFLPIVVVCNDVARDNPLTHTFGKGELLLFAGLLVIVVGVELHEVDDTLHRLKPSYAKGHLYLVFVVVGFLLLVFFATNVGRMTPLEHAPNVEMSYLEEKRAYWSVIGGCGVAASVTFALWGKWRINRMLYTGI